MTTPFSGGSYGSGISRSSSQPDALVPQPYVDEVIQVLPQYSSVLSLAHVQPMTALTERQPVLSQLPAAYWQNSGSTPGGGDYSLVKTTQAAWANQILTSEELSLDIPIPNAYLADSSVDILQQLKPLIAQAMGTAIDAACLFGTSMPSSWGATSVFGGAQAVGNVIAGSAFTVSGDTPTLDYGLGVAKAGQALAAQGFDLNGFAAAPGFKWALAGVRGSTGVPVYTPPSGDLPGQLYGYDLQEVKNGSWNAAASGGAALIAGDWSKAVVGLRQDMEFATSTDAVLTDASGAIIYNAFQSNLTVLKCTMRIAFLTANPVTPLTAVHGQSFPFAILAGNAALT